MAVRVVMCGDCLQQQRPVGSCYSLRWAMHSPRGIALRPSIVLVCTGSQKGVRSDLHLLTAWRDSTHSPLGSQTTVLSLHHPHPSLASGTQAGLGSSRTAFLPLWSQTVAMAHPTCGTCKGCIMLSVSLWSQSFPAKNDLLPPWEAQIFLWTSSAVSYQPPRVVFMAVTPSPLPGIRYPKPEPQFPAPTCPGRHADNCLRLGSDSQLPSLCRSLSVLPSTHLLLHSPLRFQDSPCSRL